MLEQYNLDQLVQPNERVDLFIRENLKIIQSKNYFAMSIDAILLADFVRLTKKSVRIMDFCSGNGVIPLLLSHRTASKIIGVELQAPLIDLARRNMLINQLQHQIKLIHQDVNDLTVSDVGTFDIITCNPPYFPLTDQVKKHQLDTHAIARHEVYLTIDQWVKKATQLLKTKGRLYIVHRPERLDDLIETLLKYGFGIYRLRFIHPKKDKRANILLIEAIYQGGRQGVRIEPPLVVHEEDGTYTQEMNELFYGD